MCLAGLASVVGWLPDGVYVVVLVIIVTDHLRASAPTVAAGFREFRSSMPRLDPDYRRRR
jgi:Sec-independent protein translocase protein TatA